MMCPPRQNQWGTQHGPAVALWMDNIWDRQTFFIKELLKNLHWMERNDWFYGTDWYETWMAWEDLNETPECPLDVMADNLASFLRDTTGWEIVVVDWTAAAMAHAHADNPGPP